jgi:hypothetical protein
MTRSGAVTCANGNGSLAYASMVACPTSVLGLRCPFDVSQRISGLGRAPDSIVEDSVS